MSAILKTIEIHGDNLQPLLNYGSDITKTALENNDIQNLLSYAANSDKTTITLPDENEKTVLVSGVLCEANTAQLEFAKSRNAYRENNPENLPSFDFLDKRENKSKSIQKQPVTAIHIIQSFQERNIDPQIVHQIGIDFCEKLGVQAVVSTHMNTDHCHNHIVINTYMPDGQSKFYMNNDKRIALRRLSDDIQKEYGLQVNFLDPQKQQLISKHSLNYREWSSHKKGQSWKDDLRDTMIAVSEVADTKDEFIDIMKDYGYSVEKQNKNDVLWNTSNNKKIWGRTLGNDFILSNIFTEADISITQPQSHVSYRQYHQTIPVISVSRYDRTGRRRTEIELIIRKAISIIQRVSNFIIRQQNKLSQKYNSKSKLNMMNEALTTLKDFGIDNVDALNEKIKLTGKDLSVSKSDASSLNAEMLYYSVAEQAINEYKNALTLYNSVHFWSKPHDNLYLNDFSDRDVNLNIAKIAPLSSKQKTELFQMMNSRPNLRLVDAGKGYCNISAIQFREIKNYFKGKGKQPECLSDITNTTASFAYEKQYNNLCERLTYEPTKKQKLKADQLLKAHDYENIDTNNLKMADIINIDNCYSQCSFTAPLVTAEQQSILTKRLQTAKKTLSRDISQITQDEYTSILSYLDGHSRKEPELLKPSLSPSDTDLDKTKKLAASLNINTTVSIDSMNKTDVRNFYNWLVSQNKEPFCVSTTNAIKHTQNKEDFHADISCETTNKQAVLIGLRNAANNLKQLGIDINDIDDVSKHIADLKQQQQDINTKRSDLSEQYKQLLRLKQQLSYTKDKNFLFGSLLDKDDIKAVKEELEKQQQQEDLQHEDNATLSDKTKTFIETHNKNHNINDDIEL